MIPPTGPDIFVQLYADILPSGSEPVPVNDTLLVGNVIDLSAPAFTVGRILAAALTVI